MTLSLIEDLSQTKTTLEEFKDVTARVLNYMPAIIDKEIEYLDYFICSSTTGGSTKRIRPFNKNLFIKNANEFEKEYLEFEEILQILRNREIFFQENQFQIVDKVLYTIQQSIGIGLDLLGTSNSSRKHVGTRFEELVRTLLSSMNVTMKKIVLSIPYDTEEGKKYYRCETDVVISPFDKIKSDSQNIHPDEIVITLKTTTKDRMPKIFIDKILMERFVGHTIRMIGISLNDIQRKDEKNRSIISYTFVSNLFMVYTKFLTQLEGYYYLDLPKKALIAPFNQYVFPFSKFILKDIWLLLNRT